MTDLDPIREQWTLEQLKDLLKDYEPEDENEKASFYKVILKVWNEGSSQEVPPGFEFLGTEEESLKCARNYTPDIPAAQARLDRITDRRLK